MCKRRGIASFLELALHLLIGQHLAGIGTAEFKQSP